MWVWNTGNVLTNATYQKTFFNNMADAKVTDIFLYMYLGTYSSTKQLQIFISKASANKMRVWALDGARQYFSDVDGPNALYQGVSALIAYNAKGAADERFVGFQTDNEPEDSGKLKAYSFHDDIPTSKLSKTGGGKWQKTEFLDREMLLRDWLDTHAALKVTLSKNGLLLGASLPSWCDDYYGEPLNCTWNGKTQTVAEHFNTILDTYNIMSYQTNTNNVVSRVKGEMSLATAQKTGVKVYAGLETHKGRGAAVTYGDNRKKNHKKIVLSDIAKIESTLRKYEAFDGVNIHDYVGWLALPA